MVPEFRGGRGQDAQHLQHLCCSREREGGNATAHASALLL